MRRLKILLFKKGGGAGSLDVYRLWDCRDALLSLEHEVTIFNLLKHGNSKGELLKELGALIDEFHPDVVFFTSTDRAVLEFLTSKEIPYGDWLLDDPLFWDLRGFCSLYGYLFAIDRAWISRIKKESLNNVFYLPLGVNPKVYREVELTEEEIRRYSCDVSFVGNAYRCFYERYYLDEIKKESSLEFKGVLDEALRVQKENPLLEMSDILEVVQEKYHYPFVFKSDIERESFELGLGFAASSLCRKEIVEELAVGIRVYGDEDWCRWPPGKFEYRGRIVYRKEKVKLYNACKVVIGATLFHLRTALTVRPFQVPACGGFIIDDYRDDLGRHFELGKEMICYRNKKELRELVEYFLKHPKEREEITQRAKAKILKEHTFKQRMEEAVKILRTTFNL